MKEQLAEISLETEESENGDVADILQDTIKELNGILKTLKKIST